MPIPNISLLTGNLQPKGHPFFVDQKTIDGSAALLDGRPLAAHLSHEGAGKDRLGTAVGFFQGIYRDGLQLRAKTFEFLDSFKANFKEKYDNLAELAAKFPDQFGVSLHLKYTPVWVMQDGSEVAAKVVDGKLAESAPAKAVRALPSARVTAIPSGDFVTNPAANLSGLLTSLLAEIDTSAKDMPATITFDQAALDAKLAEQKQTITTELSTSHKVEVDGLKAELATANTAKTEAVTALAARDTTLTATLAEVGVKVAKLDGPTIKAALTARIESEAQVLLAARGIKPLPEKIKDGTQIDAKLETDEQIATAYMALPHGTAESVAFLEKYKDAIWRSHTRR